MSTRAKFDNFNFTNYDAKTRECGNNPLRFATLALQEAPDQLKELKRLGIL